MLCRPALFVADGASSLMRRVLPTLLICMSVCQSLQARADPVFTRLDGSSLNSSQIDDTVTGLMRAAEVPGLALALINHGRVVYLKAYGVRTAGTKQPLTTDSVMVAASLTKVASAYLVMKLVDDHLIGLDKPVVEYLPRPLSDYADWRDLTDDPRYKLITTRMLLSHTAGLNNWRYFDPAHRLRIHYQPGTRYAYCGECFDLLQVVVESVTGKPTEQLMQERVFRPLGMTRTSMLWRSSFESDHADGFDEYRRSLGHQRRATAEAAGSMQTTVTDYSKLVLAILSGRGLSKEAHAQMLGMQIPIVSKFEFPTLSPDNTEEYQGIHLAYGLGVGRYQTPAGPAVFKEGHDEGWRNYFVCHQQQVTCMLVMTNSSNGEGIYSGLLKGLLGDTWNPIDWEGFTPYDKLPPRRPLSDHKAIQLPPFLLALYAGRYGTRDNQVTVEPSGDHLSVTQNGTPQQDFFPQTASIYFSKTTGETFSFLFDIDTHAFRIVRDAAGKVDFLPNLDWSH